MADAWVHWFINGKAESFPADSVTDEGVSAPTEPAVDLTDVIRGVTLDTDAGRFTWDQGIRLRMYRFTDQGNGEQP